MGAALNRAGCA